MTAWGSIRLAVQGMQAGAFDFITKPWNNAAPVPLHPSLSGVADSSCSCCWLP